jgi:hypothetical protein
LVYNKTALSRGGDIFLEINNSEYCKNLEYFMQIKKCKHVFMIKCSQILLMALKNFALKIIFFFLFWEMLESATCLPFWVSFLLPSFFSSFFSSFFYFFSTIYFIFPVLPLLVKNCLYLSRFFLYPLSITRCISFQAFQSIFLFLPGLRFLYQTPW